MKTLKGKSGGMVLVNGQPYSPDRINIHFEDPEITIECPGTKYHPVLKAAFTDIVNEDTGLAFGSFAEMKGFVLANFGPNVPGGGNVLIKVDTFGGDPGGVYTLTETPVVGTISGMVNGVGTLVNYGGSGNTVTIDPGFAVDETDTITFTYAYEISE